MTSFRHRLDTRQPQIGLCVNYPGPGVVERIGAEWDFVWIDGQHGQLDYNDTLHLVRACELVGTAPLVRVPWMEAGAIGKVLDTAAAGVIVPCIDTVEEARAAVDAARFPPEGRRSFGGRRPVDRWGRAYADSANREQLLIVQIESPAAVEAAADIAAIDGVDALMIGPDDLLLRRGVPVTAQRSPDMLRDDMQAIAAAAHQNGKLLVGLGFDEAMVRLNLELGYHMIVSGGDVPFLTDGSKQAAAMARKTIDGTEARTVAALAGPY